MRGLHLAAIAALVIAVGVLATAGPVSAQESLGAGSAPVTTVPSATFGRSTCRGPRRWMPRRESC